MKCPNCNTPDSIQAVVTLYLKLPLLKGGSIKPPAITIAQVKELWDNTPEDNRPVECAHCHAQFRYYSGGRGLVRFNPVGEA